MLANTLKKKLKMKPIYCSRCVESYIECLKEVKLHSETECWKKFQECLKICVTADKKDFAYFYKA